MKAIVVLSGGMDSAVLAAHLLDSGGELTALSVNYGQRHHRELEYAQRIAEHYRIPWRCADLSMLRPFLAGSSQTSPEVPVPHGHYADETMKATVVPNRNMLLLAVAGAWAISTRAGAIAYAAHAGDHPIYPDCRPAFVEAFAETLLLADWHPVVMLAPFLRWTKGAICRRGVELGVPFELTYSCYAGAPVHCGACGTCVERIEAFREAHAIDPTEYAR